jgi:hypothetical protein
MASDRVAALLDHVGEMNADIEDLVEAQTKAYKDRFWELLVFPSERDPGIFEAAEADTEYSVTEYLEMPVVDRTVEWSISLASVWAASRMQAMYETGILHDLVDMSEKNGEIMNALSKPLSRVELKRAVDTLPGSGVTDAAKARRKVL